MTVDVGSLVIAAEAPPAVPAVQRAAGAGPRWLLPSFLAAGIATLAVCLLAGGVVSAGSLPGLPDAGAGTRWALPVAAFVAETAAVLALGAALLASALIPRGGEPSAATARAHIVSTAGRLSWLAATATLVVFGLTLSDLTARPLPEALTLGAVAELASFGPGELLLLSAAGSALGAGAAWWAAHRLTRSSGFATRSVLLVGVLAAALIPWALGGHTTQAGQDIAASALIVHVLAAGAWMGGLAIMILHVRGDLLLTVLPRFSTLALWSWLAIGVSGVITGWLRVGAFSDLWTSGYGRLLLVKLLALGTLGMFGAWHRRRLTAGLRTLSIGQRTALIRVAAVEVVVMGATMGVATALSATPPPSGHATGHESAHGTPRIEAMLGHRIPVISAENLAVLWRPDVIVLLLAAVGLAAYFGGVRKVRAHGNAWPAGRAWWATVATAATILALNSGIATYDGAVWSVTVTAQSITSMLIPLAIVLARPWQLVPVSRRSGRVTGAVGWLLARPWWVLVAYAGWTALSLLTPLALWSVTSHPVLMVTRLADIVSGTALFAVLLASGRSDRRADGQPTTSAMTVPIAWFATQAVLTAVLAGGAIAARPWFSELNLAWIGVAQDERTAALIHLGVAIATLLLVAALPAAEIPRNRPPNAAAGKKIGDSAVGPIGSADGGESMTSSISVTSDQRG